VEQKMSTENRQAVDLPPENKHHTESQFVVKEKCEAEGSKGFQQDKNFLFA